MQISTSFTALLALVPFLVASVSAQDVATSLTLDNSVIAKGFELTGQETPADGQVASLTSTNNFINFCAGKTITDGKQVTGGSCNPAPMGDIPSTQNMPSSKFVFPKNGQKTIKEDEPFTIQMAVSKWDLGNFVNAAGNYYSAPQQLNAQGQIIGHSHVVIEEITALDQTTVTDPNTFAFFKGVNGAAVQGVVTADVTQGLPAGFYRLSSINAAANHQPVLAPIAQHGSMDDVVYFEVVKAGADGAADADADTEGVATVKEVETATATSSTAAAATTTAKAGKGGKGGNGSTKDNTGTTKGDTGATKGSEATTTKGASAAAETTAAQATAAIESTSAPEEPAAAVSECPVPKTVTVTVPKSTQAAVSSTVTASVTESVPASATQSASPASETESLEDASSVSSKVAASTGKAVPASATQSASPASETESLEAASSVSSKVAASTGKAVAASSTKETAASVTSVAEDASTSEVVKAASSTFSSVEASATSSKVAAASSTAAAAKTNAKVEEAASTQAAEPTASVGSDKTKGRRRRGLRFARQY